MFGQRSGVGMSKWIIMFYDDFDSDGTLRGELETNQKAFRVGCPLAHEGCMREFRILAC